MKISGWTPKGIHIPSSAKRDAILLLALYLVNCFIFSAWLQLGTVAARPWLALIWLYGLAALVPLLWRGSAPVVVYTTQLVFTAAAWPIFSYYTPVAGIPVALYAVSLHCSKKISVLALAVSFIPNTLVAAAAFSNYPDSTDQLTAFISNALFLFLMTAGAWVAGRLTQASQRHVQHLERERETIREAEVLAAERRRIARELHDIVSHAVTVIVLQAAGATRVADKDLVQVRQSLAHIEATAKQTMAELRRLLGVLDASDPADQDGDISDLEPQPGLADLTKLLTSLRATGMPVTNSVEGAPRNLDPSVDLAAYRIVREGLTNVLKHAGKDANPRLRLVWEAQSLLIQIDNDINLAEAYGEEATSAGRGLVGLNERVHAAGGRLHAGLHEEGGYRLTATLPVATPATPPRVSSITVPRAFTQGRGD